MKSFFENCKNKIKTTDNKDGEDKQLKKGSNKKNWVRNRIFQPTSIQLITE